MGVYFCGGLFHNLILVGFIVFCGVADNNASKKGKEKRLRVWQTRKQDYYQKKSDR